MKDSGQIIQSINPADGTVVWEGPGADQAATRTAVIEAGKAFPDWSARPIEQRAEILQSFAAILEQQKEELAALIAREIGKPLWEAKTEVAAMNGKIKISIAAHEKRCSEFRGGNATTRFRPHGVLAVLGPYNFPGHLPNGHICPALLAGNTIVFKPSELAPATGEKIGQYWAEAGLPDGVLQILQGGAQTAIALTGEARLDGVLFTGSAATGKKLAAQMATTPGRILALEMGGNNPLIVDPGNLENIPAAAEIALRSAFLSAGQRCTCARRLLVIDSSAASAFTECLIERTQGLTVGDPFADPPPFMGPLASVAFPPQILLKQTDRLAAGGISLLEAKSLRPETGYLSPGIIDVTPVEQLPDEEIFGPLLQLIRVPDLHTAVETANNTRFGLAAGILTDDEAQYRYAGPLLQAGIINWNTPLTGASSAAPFGGIKDSGNLRPSAYFAADYCSYPVASMEAPACTEQAPLPGQAS